MKSSRIFPFAMLAALLAVGAYRSAESIRSDALLPAESMPTRIDRLSDPIEPALGSAKDRYAIEQNATAASWQSPLPQPLSLDDSPHEPIPSDAPGLTAESSENQVDRDIEVSVYMKDGTTKTFSGPGVMFTADGKAMPIPKDGYRISADGTLKPYESDSSEVAQGPKSP
ncbi:MAG: hypothetical protein IT473_07775 [Lysobacter sp.]|nr:hypothetical protein [Lysobacter sp.]